MPSVRPGQELASPTSGEVPTALQIVLGAVIALLTLDRDRRRPAPVAGGERTGDIARNDTAGRDSNENSGSGCG